MHRSPTAGLLQLVLAQEQALALASVLVQVPVQAQARAQVPALGKEQAQVCWQVPAQA